MPYIDKNEMFGLESCAEGQAFESIPALALKHKNLVSEYLTQGLSLETGSPS